MPIAMTPASLMSCGSLAAAASSTVTSPAALDLSVAESVSLLAQPPSTSAATVMSAAGASRPFRREMVRMLFLLGG